MRKAWDSNPRGEWKLQAAPDEKARREVGEMSALRADKQGGVGGRAATAEGAPTHTTGRAVDVCCRGPGTKFPARGSGPRPRSRLPRSLRHQPFSTNSPSRIANSGTILVHSLRCQQAHGPHRRIFDIACYLFPGAVGEAASAYVAIAASDRAKHTYSGDV